MAVNRIANIDNHISELSSKIMGIYTFRNQLSKLLDHINTKNMSRIVYGNKKIDEIIILYSFMILYIQYIINDKYNNNKFINTVITTSHRLNNEILELNNDSNLDESACPRYLRDIAYNKITYLMNLLKNQVID